jgi:hypothetical protein
MIVQLRGTSAAGKTTIVSRLLEQSGAKPIYGLFGAKRPQAMRATFGARHLFALGPYPASGADAIVSAAGVEGVIELLDRYASRGDVLFEGLIISSMWGAVGKWLEAHKAEVIIAQITASLEECRASLSERQGDGGHEVKSQANHHARAIRVCAKAAARGICVVPLDRANAVETIAGWLRGDRPTAPAVAPVKAPPKGLASILAFGDELIATRDLDPAYCGLVDANLPEPQLARLLLSYLAFYDLGLAAWLSEHEGGDYWAAMLIAARNETPSPRGERWPRASERRHFRGGKCVAAVEWLRDTYSEPEAPIRSLLVAESEKAVMDLIGKWPMFGPWAGFKAADLIDRVYGHTLRFDPNLNLLFDAPRESLGNVSHRAGSIAARARDKMEAAGPSWGTGR